MHSMRLDFDEAHDLEQCEKITGKFGQTPQDTRIVPIAMPVAYCQWLTGSSPYEATRLIAACYLCTSRAFLQAQSSSQPDP